MADPTLTVYCHPDEHAEIAELLAALAPAVEVRCSPAVRLGAVFAVGRASLAAGAARIARTQPPPEPGPAQ